MKKTKRILTSLILSIMLIVPLFAFAACNFSASNQTTPESDQTTPESDQTTETQKYTEDFENLKSAINSLTSQTVVTNGVRIEWRTSSYPDKPLVFEYKYIPEEGRVYAKLQFSFDNSAEHISYHRFRLSDGTIWGSYLDNGDGTYTEVNDIYGYGNDSGNQLLEYIKLYIGGYRNKEIIAENKIRYIWENSSSKCIVCIYEDFQISYMLNSYNKLTETSSMNGTAALSTISYNISTDAYAKYCEACHSI